MCMLGLGLCPWRPEEGVGSTRTKKLQVIVSHPYRVLGIQHQSSARAARTPNYSHLVKKKT